MTHTRARQAVAAICTAVVAAAGLTACRPADDDMRYTERTVIVDRDGRTTTRTTTRTVTKTKPKAKQRTQQRSRSRR